MNIEEWIPPFHVEFISNENELLDAKIWLDAWDVSDMEYNADIAWVKGVGLTKKEALEHIRDMLNNEIDRLIGELKE